MHTGAQQNDGVFKLIHTTDEYGNWPIAFMTASDATSPWLKYAMK